MQTKPPVLFQRIGGFADIPYLLFFIPKKRIWIFLSRIGELTVFLLSRIREFANFLLLLSKNGVAGDVARDFLIMEF